MQLDIDRLWQYHTDGLLRHSAHADRDLHVWCYSTTTVFTRAWDDLTQLCRGLVTDSKGNVISRPFPKFFNLGEPETGEIQLNAPFIAYDKMDGTLIVVGVDEAGERVVSTKGSFSTWHSEHATELLGNFKPQPGWTCIFELISPGNRIVVNYGEIDALFLLGAVHNETGEDHFTPVDVAEFHGWYGNLAIDRHFVLQRMIATCADPENGLNKEGFVLVYPLYPTLVLDEDGTVVLDNDGVPVQQTSGPSKRVKIKFAQYMALHHALSQLSNVAVWEALKEDRLEGLLDVVPDEYYPQVTECVDQLNQAYNDVYAANYAVAAHVQFWANRKDQAAYIIENAPVAFIAFGILDDKDLSEKIWNLVKPELDRSWSFLK